MTDFCFIHNPNGTININGSIFTEEVFKLVEPLYNLPTGATSRRYIPGKKHTVTYGKNFQKGQAKTWPAGDRYISRSKDVEYLLNNFEEHDLIHMREVLKKQMKTKMDIIED